MYDQAKYEPYESSTFFSDSLSARPFVPGTVARRMKRASAPRLYRAGRGDAFPRPVDAAMMARGRERFTIYCSPCHGALGDGRGIVVSRGLTPPPSFHSERLRNMPPGHVVEVIEQGWGRMYPYASRVSPDDRWAIAAYIVALQRSQRASISDVPEAERSKLEERSRQ